MNRDQITELVGAQPVGTVFIWGKHVLRKVGAGSKGRNSGRWVRVTKTGAGSPVSDFPIINSIVSEGSPWSFS